MCQEAGCPGHKLDCILARPLSLMVLQAKPKMLQDNNLSSLSSPCSRRSSRGTALGPSARVAAPGTNSREMELLFMVMPRACSSSLLSMYLQHVICQDVLVVTKLHKLAKQISSLLAGITRLPAAQRPSVPQPPAQPPPPPVQHPPDLPR